MTGGGGGKKGMFANSCVRLYGNLGENGGGMLLTLWQTCAKTLKNIYACITLNIIFTPRGHTVYIYI